VKTVYQTNWSHELCTPTGERRPPRHGEFYVLGGDTNGVAVKAGGADRDYEGMPPSIILKKICPRMAQRLRGQGLV
jgi:hypothetical protein